MKFQIMTYQRLKSTTEVVNPWVATAIGLPWPLAGELFYSDTPEGARDKVIKAAQTWFDENYTNLTITEVEMLTRAVGNDMEVHITACREVQPSTESV
jgi:hypothetical protein